MFVVSVTIVLKNKQKTHRRPQSTPATALPIAAPTPNTNRSDDA